MKKRTRGVVSAPDVKIDALGDKSHLHLKTIPNALFGPPQFILESVPVSKVGHTFKLAPPPYSGPKEYMVQDFILDQTGASGTDGKMMNETEFDLTTATLFAFVVYAKTRNRKIRVKLPPGGESVLMGLNVGRRFVNATSDVYLQSVAISQFFTLQGTAPVFTYNSFFIGRNTNHWIEFVVHAELSSPIIFSAFRAVGVYPPRPFDPGTKKYNPLSHSLPFNLPGPNSVPYLMFSYRTADPVDPGPFVSIS